jgi:hypothetical protein
MYTVTAVTTQVWDIAFAIHASRPKHHKGALPPLSHVLFGLVPSSSLLLKLWLGSNIMSVDKKLSWRTIESQPSLAEGFVVFGE